MPSQRTVVESFGDTALLAKAMALCCDSQLAPDGGIVGDPTENALIAFALNEGLDRNILSAEYPRISEAPFDSIRKMMSTIHKNQGCFIQYTKGAPDEVLRVCTHALVDGEITLLEPVVMQKIITQNSEYADKALRVLACAYLVKAIQRNLNK